MRCALLFLLWSHLASALASSLQPVFVLHSYSQEYPWTRGQHQGFVQALNADPSRTYDLKVEYLDSKRIRYGADYAESTARHLRQKYDGYRPVAIYVTDDNALSFALAHADKLFPGVPVFFSGVNDYDVRKRLDHGRFTGVFEKKEIAPNLQVMRRIDPTVRDIVIVGDASETYQAIESEIRSELTRFPEIRATYVSSNRIDEITARLQAHDERFVFLTTLGAVKDGAGTTLSLAETIAAIVGGGRFVVFSMEDAYLYPGVLGGYVTSGPRQGQAAARLLQRHLDGVPVSALPAVEASPNEYIVDDRELARAKLTVPGELDGQVTRINVEPTFYELHRSEILGALYSLTALLLLSLGGSALLYARKSRQIAVSSRQLAEANERLERAQRIALMGNWDWHIPQNKLYWSEGIYRLFGIDPTEFGASYEAFLERVHPLDRDAVETAVKRTFEFGEPYDMDHRIVRPGGEVRIVHESAEVVRDAENRPVRMIGTVQDVTERKLAERALQEKDAFLEHIAYHDALTGLPNRALAIDRVTHAISRAERTGGTLAVLFVDLDRFKTINDSLGHARGDALLQSAATRLRALVRAEDTVSRFGGDEFVILLEDVTDPQGPATVAEKIIQALSQVFVVDGYQLHVSASVGISLYPQDGRDADTLMKNADAAMYKAKESGRDNFQFYAQALTVRVMRRVHLETRLRSAFEQQALEVHYQPVVCLETRRIRGVEALLRWNDPLEGPIPPDQFIPLAEETGLIIALGEWVIRESCQALRRWERAGAALEGFALHINLSSRQLLQRTLPQQVRAILEQTGVSPANVVLELTESTILEGEEHRLTALRAIGVSIAIDDFGTGHSSLGRLRQLPISEIKVDRAFIRDVPGDADDGAIVQAILAMSASLGLTVIAEGVEQAGQEDFLLAHGCRLAQGFRYARPMPEDDLLPLLLAGRPLLATDAQGRSEPVVAGGLLEVS